MAKTRTRTTTAARTTKVPVARRRAFRPGGNQLCVGTVVDWDAKGPLVDFDGNAGAPVRARVLGLGGPVRISGAAASMAGREVVLMVDPRPGKPPVLLGLLTPLGEDTPAKELEARVDGRRVELEGREEIVLKCGEASITLRSNGRVVIRGANVETRATGINRIKGGSVAIN